MVVVVDAIKVAGPTSTRPWCPGFPCTHDCVRVTGKHGAPMRAAISSPPERPVFAQDALGTIRETLGTRTEVLAPSYTTSSGLRPDIERQERTAFTVASSMVSLFLPYWLHRWQRLWG